MTQRRNEEWPDQHVVELQGQELADDKGNKDLDRMIHRLVFQEVIQSCPNRGRYHADPGVHFVVSCKLSPIDGFDRNSEEAVQLPFNSHRQNYARNPTIKSGFDDD